eukprot:5683996-Amphidinium_carterae.1
MVLGQKYFNAILKNSSLEPGGLKVASPTIRVWLVVTSSLGCASSEHAGDGQSHLQRKVPTTPIPEHVCTLFSESRTDKSRSITGSHTLTANSSDNLCSSHSLYKSSCSYVRPTVSMSPSWIWRSV